MTIIGNRFPVIYILDENGDKNVDVNIEDEGSKISVDEEIETSVDDEEIKIKNEKKISEDRVNDITSLGKYTIFGPGSYKGHIKERYDEFHKQYRGGVNAYTDHVKGGTLNLFNGIPLKDGMHAVVLQDEWINLPENQYDSLKFGCDFLCCINSLCNSIISCCGLIKYDPSSESFTRKCTIVHPVSEYIRQGEESRIKNMIKKKDYCLCFLNVVNGEAQKLSFRPKGCVGEVPKNLIVTFGNVVLKFGGGDVVFRPLQDKGETFNGYITKNLTTENLSEESYEHRINKLSQEIRNVKKSNE